VKENRDACPCILALDFSGLPVTPVAVDVEGEGYSFTETLHQDTVLVLPVPRGGVAVSAVGGALSGSDGSIRIPEGEEAQPLYLFHLEMQAVGDRVTVPVHLRKQFCRLELRFTGPPGYGPPFEVEVEGSVGGWLSDGNPLPGSFFHRILPGSDGRAVPPLPRQSDDSLRMHIVFSDQVVRTFSLGSYIADAGYDWSAPDLGDLVLQVDISLTSITLSTDLWTKTEEIELWI